MDKYVHKPDGSLVVDDPWVVGSKVIKLTTGLHIPKGETGIIHSMDKYFVKINWPRHNQIFPYNRTVLGIAIGTYDGKV